MYNLHLFPPSSTLQCRHVLALLFALLGSLGGLATPPAIDRYEDESSGPFIYEHFITTGCHLIVFTVALDGSLQTCLTNYCLETFETVNF